MSRRDIGIIAVSVLASLISLGANLYTAGLDKGMRMAYLWESLYDSERSSRLMCESRLAEVKP